ncbi:MAG: phosphatase PAP2 family protein [Chitinophagaceae bacterium]|nr:MAG: phosphatase PAP2 family protein [Chitinophagaceae bacterium]
MMRERLAVDGNNQLAEIRETTHQPQNPVIRFVASLLSYLFHPLFVPVIIAWFLIRVQPQFFASGDRNHWIVLIRFFVSYSFFPLVTILLLKGLGFISSVFLRTQKERIIPYMACGIYYFWMAYVFRHQPEFAPQVVQLTIAIFIASSLGLMANIYLKVSMHAMSMGVGLAFITLLSFDAPGFTLYMSLALLLTGLVCTARMIVSDHYPAEIYTGLVIGILSMLLGVWADGILP